MGERREYERDRRGRCRGDVLLRVSFSWAGAKRRANWARRFAFGTSFTFS
jgi:hypothetical protein